MGLQKFLELIADFEIRVQSRIFTGYTHRFTIGLIGTMFTSNLREIDNEALAHFIFH